jgi:crotonobetaine/carnitine-CoA ligase
MYLQDDDCVMVVLPLFHINAMFYSVAGTLAAGASMVIIPKFSASTFWQTAVDTGATTVNIIEAIGSILRTRPRSEFRPEHRIARVYGVRASMDETFKNEFNIAHRISGYGMTEIPGVTCNPFEGPKKLGSMGPIGRHPDPARPWAQCRVVDAEGRDLPDGEPGELWVKTPIIMQGYFRDPEQTANTFQDGWFKTGDMVKRDSDGYFYFISRIRDIIRRRGENISSFEVEAVLRSHASVADCAVIGVPADQQAGEDEVMAFLVPRDGAELDYEQIWAWCEARMPAFMVPRYLEAMAELPRTPTEKVRKKQLREQGVGPRTRDRTRP